MLEEGWILYILKNRTLPPSLSLPVVMATAVGGCMRGGSDSCSAAASSTDLNSCGVM